MVQIRALSASFGTAENLQPAGNRQISQVFSASLANGTVCEDRHLDTSGMSLRDFDSLHFRDSAGK